VDRYVVDGLVNLTASCWMPRATPSAVQNGQIQSYALAMLIGIFLIIGAGRFLLACTRSS